MMVIEIGIGTSEGFIDMSDVLYHGFMSDTLLVVARRRDVDLVLRIDSHDRWSFQGFQR